MKDIQYTIKEKPWTNAYYKLSLSNYIFTKINEKTRNKDMDSMEIIKNDLRKITKVKL